MKTTVLTTPTMVALSLFTLVYVAANWQLFEHNPDILLTLIRRQKMLCVY